MKDMQGLEDYFVGRSSVFKELEMAKESIIENAQKAGAVELTTAEYHLLLSIYSDEDVRRIIDYPKNYKKRLKERHKGYLRLKKEQSTR